MTAATVAAARPPSAFGRLRALAVKPEERRGVVAAFLCAFFMFAAYSILRPVREAMGITSGVSTLPVLFWASFGCMLALQPLYGLVLARVPRERALPRIYAFFAATLVAFHAWFFLQADHTWVARAYFVWVSVFNLFVVAVFWSLMADVYSREQAGRLFGCIAGGLSIGGLVGSALAGWLAAPLGSIHLLLVAAALLGLAALLMRLLIRWQPRAAVEAPQEPQRAFEGGAFAAFSQVIKVPYLRGIAVFVLLLTAVTTVLYLEQQRVVALAVSSADARTALFARVDFWVQTASLIGQMLLFGPLLRRWGFTAVLAAMPLVMLAAFGLLGMTGSLDVVVVALAIRRVGEYALTRPSRDMLMAVVPRAQKYQAKGLIDTFMYRGGDALSASAFAALGALPVAPGRLAAFAGAVLCVAWVGVAWWLGRRFEAMGEGAAEPVVEPRVAPLPRAQLGGEVG